MRETLCRDVSHLTELVEAALFLCRPPESR
jgi:hypothetical protein